MRTVTLRLNGLPLCCMEVEEPQPISKEEQLLRAIFGEQPEDEFYEWCTHGSAEK